MKINLVYKSGYEVSLIIPISKQICSPDQRTDLRDSDSVF